MKINLYKNYWVTSNERNYIVNVMRKGVLRDGVKTDVLEEIRWFRTMGGCIDYICEVEPRFSRCTTFDGMMREYIKMQKMIEDLDIRLLEKYPMK